MLVAVVSEWCAARCVVPVVIRGAGMVHCLLHIASHISHSLCRTPQPCIKSCTSPCRKACVAQPPIACVTQRGALRAVLRVVSRAVLRVVRTICAVGGHGSMHWPMPLTAARPWPPHCSRTSQRCSEKTPPAYSGCCHCMSPGAPISTPSPTTAKNPPREVRSAALGWYGTGPHWAGTRRARYARWHAQPDAARLTVRLAVADGRVRAVWWRACELAPRTGVRRIGCSNT